MKKHFLLLLWMTLLPLAGWAQLIDMTTFTVTMDQRAFDYTGAVPSIQMTVRDPQQVQPVSEDYYEWKFYASDRTTVLSPDQVKDAGSYYVSAKAKEGSTMYQGETEKLLFRIDKIALTSEKVSIANFAEKTYNGEAQTYEDSDFDGKVTVDGVTTNDGVLVLNTDYTVEYQYNVNANNVVEGQEPTIIFTAKEGSNYTGSVKKTFNINPLSIVNEQYELAENFSLVNTAAMNGLVYDGTNHEPTVRLAWKGSSLSHSVLENAGDYKKTYANNKNATTEQQKATITFTAKHNFTGEYVKEFEIAQRDITGNDEITVTEGLNELSYTAVAQTPAITVHDALGTINANLTDNDFEIPENGWANNKNACEAEAENAPSVTINGIGNYTGSKTFKFAIAKAGLTITTGEVDDIAGVYDKATNTYKKSYGSNDPEFHYTVGELQGNDTEDTAITGDVAWKFYDAEEEGTEAATHSAIGTYFVEPSALTAKNYEITYKRAKLVVQNAEIWVVPDNVEAAYGADATEMKYHLEDAQKNKVALNSVNITTQPTLTREDPDNKNVKVDEEGNVVGYEITASDAEIENFVVYFDRKGTYTITKAPLTLTARTQKIYFGGEVHTGTGSGNGTHGALDRVVDVTSEQAYPPLTIDVEGLVNNDTRASLGLSLTYNDENIKVGDNEGVLVIAATNTNYKYTYNHGTVVVLADAAGLALDDSKDDNLTKIAAFDRQRVNVTINFAARNNRELPVGTAREWKANTWNTLVLPFDISVADLSKALGYAIVNVIDPSRTEISGTGSKFYGKLTMKGGNGYVDPTDPDNDAKKDTKLAANKPFMVKTADAITGIVDFGPQTIVAPESAADYTVDAGKGAEFIGTYTTKEVTGDANANIWFMVGNNNQWLYIGAGKSHVWNILPFEGFIDMTNAPAGARSMTFYFEEIDGSTTAIKSVSTDDLGSNKLDAKGWYNLNGMKLNTVPTQKGVYIKDGKKVVIK